MSDDTTEIVTRLVADNGRFPNNDDLPLIIIRGALAEREASPELFEKLFTRNKWPAAWRNGLHDVHHYHSTAHEVLGVYSGWVEACFGGPGGELLKLRRGDVIIIPAGVSHCNMSQSKDFRVVGGYPAGQVWDMRYGEPEERPTTDTNIKAVDKPVFDPVFGCDGPLIRLWR